MKYLGKNIVELHEALVNKEVTPVELTKEVIEACKKDTNNAFEYIMEKEALDYASKLGEPEADNLLWGIPFAIKDNFSTKDVPTTGSSNILNGYVPVYNATVVEKLLAKKAIPVAKTTLDELAMGGSGTTGHLGKTYNPYDPTHTHQVGGSSAGSAAVTAAGIVPFALGSDTGDSVRKPASYAGLVGFKGTWGRVSRYGLFPFAPSLDHVAYFTRNVFDSALLLNTLAGRDELDSTSATKPVDNYLSKINDGLKGTRIAVIKEIVDSISNKTIRDTFDNLLSKMKEAGASIEYKSMDNRLLTTLFPTYLVISCAEATSNNANLDGIKFGPFHQAPTYQEEMMASRSEGFSELIRRRFVIGSFSLMKENQNELFLRAQKNRRLIVNTLNELMKDYDVVILPAAPSTAITFDSASDRLSDEYLIADNHMVLGNFAGLPSISLPMGFEDKLPFACNIMGHAYDEVKVFQIAKGVEDLTGLKDIYAKEDR